MGALGRSSRPRPNLLLPLLPLPTLRLLLLRRVPPAARDSQPVPNQRQPHREQTTRAAARCAHHSPQLELSRLWLLCKLLGGRWQGHSADVCRRQRHRLHPRPRPPLRRPVSCWHLASCIFPSVPARSLRTGSSCAGLRATCRCSPAALRSRCSPGCTSTRWRMCGREPYDCCWHLGCILPRVPAITVRTGHGRSWRSARESRTDRPQHSHLSSICRTANAPQHRRLWALAVRPQLKAACPKHSSKMHLNVSATFANLKR